MNKIKREIDLSKLPVKKYGKGTCIDWEKAVGQEIPFYYDKIIGKFLIKEHKKGNYIVVRYNGKEKTIRTSHLAQGKFRGLISSNRKIEKYIDFSGLTKKHGKNDWMHSKGCILPFCCGTIQGKLKIVDCEVINTTTYLTIQYKDRTKKIKSINLLNGKIAKFIGYGTGDYRYEKGETVVGQNKNITIINRKRYNSKGISRKKYEYCCNICRICRLGRGK